MTQPVRRVPILILALLMLFPALALVAKEKSAPPTEVSCLTVSMDGQEFHRDLAKPIPVTSKGEIRSAFVRLGQEMQLFGSDAEKVKGARLVEAALKGDYEVGRVCYVLMNYCAPNCFGNGCAIVKFPYVK